MSGDLISRSELIKEMRKLHPNWHLETMGHLVKAGIEECVEIAKSQPTAYNVDKVVEQFERKKSNEEDYCVEDREVVKFCNGVIDGFIEIVKAGGVE